MRINVYTGKPGFSIIVRKYMIGTKFGYYAVCSKTGDFHPINIKRKQKRPNIKKKGKKVKKKIKKSLKKAVKKNENSH